MDSRQARRDKLMGKKGVSKSNQTTAGAPPDMGLRPNPMAPQGRNNQDLNSMNLREQQPGIVRMNPAQMDAESAFGEPGMFTDVVAEGRMGYVSGNAPPSGRRPERSGYRGQNIAFEQGVLDTPAQSYGQIEQNYMTMQAMTAGAKNNPQGGGIPSFQLSGLGMNGGPAMGFPEPPSRSLTGEELALPGVPSADISSAGMNMSGPNTSGRNKKSSKTA